MYMSILYFKNCYQQKLGNIQMYTLFSLYIYKMYLK